MKGVFRKAKEAVEALFWDTCFVEEFQEERTDWGECLHQKTKAAEGFPCRLTEKTKECGQNGLLTETKKSVTLLYPADRNILPGSSVLIRKENGMERRYTIAGDSRIFLTHKAVGLKRKETV